MELPVLEKKTTTRQLVQWAGASGDFNEIHYDKPWAEKTGLPGLIIHGRLKAAFLGQLVTDWMGPAGTLKKIDVAYRGMDFPGDTVKCKGKVVKKYTRGRERLVDVEVWTENAKGEKTTPGTATVALPARR
ncbi:MAG: dehydratase [Chloroflexi bacterium]|nr:dehydratase [Chloroflexota bacterium]MBI4215826.1 dehydratase [Chloroflexota bacterium]